jgi:hypothetical protein
MDEDLELIIRRRERLHTGDSLSDLNRSLKRGDLVAVAPGTYLPSVAWNALGPRRRHRLRVLASVIRLKSEPVISHFAAAAIWGLEVWGRWPTTIDVLVASGKGRSSGSIRRHGADLSRHEVTLYGGFAVTTPAQTAVDIASIVPFAEAVVTIDSARRETAAGLPLATYSQLRAACERLRGTAGSARASAALEFSSGLAESPLESVSRVRIAEAGFADPVLQHPFRLRDGRLARVDFWWPEEGIIGEADGRGKYAGAVGDAAATRASVIAEKNRENELRRLSSGIVRWEHADVTRPGRLSSLLRSAGLRNDMSR